MVPSKYFKLGMTFAIIFGIAPVIAHSEEDSMIRSKLSEAHQHGGEQGAKRSDQQDAASNYRASGERDDRL